MAQRLKNLSSVTYQEPNNGLRNYDTGKIMLYAHEKRCTSTTHDDLQSLGFCLVEATLGKLPWAASPSSEYAMKRSMIRGEESYGCDPTLMTFLRVCGASRAADGPSLFKTSPDYAQLLGILQGNIATESVDASIRWTQRWMTPDVQQRSSMAEQLFEEELGEQSGKLVHKKRVAGKMLAAAAAAGTGGEGSASTAEHRKRRASTRVRTMQ
jgi:hypothetical protein